MSALTVRGLSKRFGPVEVLKDVNLEIESGAFTVLVGPSGCGKSTLLAIIAGLENASAGDIEIGDRSMNGVAAKDRNIAMVFQSYALYPAMTVRQNITFGMECRGVPKGRQREAVDRVARLLQIEALLDRRPAQLSGSGWRWGGRWCGTRRCFCSTSRCRTWMRSCGWRCGPRSSSCTRVSARRACM